MIQHISQYAPQSIIFMIIIFFAVKAVQYKNKYFLDVQKVFQNCSSKNVVLFIYYKVVLVGGIGSFV